MRPWPGLTFSESFDVFSEHGRAAHESIRTGAISFPEPHCGAQGFRGAPHVNMLSVLPAFRPEEATQERCPDATSCSGQKVTARIFGSLCAHLWFLGEIHC